MQLSRGASDLHNMRVSKVVLQVDRAHNFFTILVQNQKLVDFAVSQQLNLEQCKSWVIIEQNTLLSQSVKDAAEKDSEEDKEKEQNPGQLQALHIHCAIKYFPSYVYAHIVKTPEVESYIIKLEDKEYPYKKFKQEVLQRLNGNTALDFDDEFDDLFPVGETVVHSVNIHVSFQPKLLYFIDGELGVSDW